MEPSNTEKLDFLMKRKGTLEAELNEVLASIAVLTNNNTRTNWQDLALHSLKKFDQFLQTEDVFNDHFADLKNYMDEKKIRNSVTALSIALNRMCSTGVLKKLVVNEVKGHFYGLPEWFNEDNKTIKNIHLKLVSERIKEKISQPLTFNKRDLLAMM